MNDERKGKMMKFRFNVGDRVIRQIFKGKIGTIKGITGDRAYVEWGGALQPFRGGSADNHSTLKLQSILPATEANLAKYQAARADRRLAWAKKRYEECKGWTYCPHCHTRFLGGEYICYRCGSVDADEIEYWLDTPIGQEVVDVISNYCPKWAER